MKQGSKSPWIAAISSFFIPGLGQLYNKEYKKSLSFFVVAIVFFVLANLVSLLFGIFSWIIAFLSAYDAYETAKEKYQLGR